MRAVVVTGTSSGIGAATALELAARGYTVFAGVRREADGAALRERASGDVRPLLLDVTDQGAIDAAAEEVGAAAGDLAGLVNNAGIALAAPLEYLPAATFRRQLEVNVVGQLAVTQAFLPLIRRAGGRILNVGSIGDRIVGPMTGAYHASKFALAALTDGLRLELADDGIEVVLIEPGTIATSIWATSTAAADRLVAGLPPEAMQRYGRAIEAAREWAQTAARTGIAPEAVARVIATALTTPRPRTRYLVGREAKIAAVIATLPDRLRDRLILRQGRSAQAVSPEGSRHSAASASRRVHSVVAKSASSCWRPPLAALRRGANTPGMRPSTRLASGAQPHPRCSRPSGDTA
jgi:NAD(P)-dependent dehydrogenase (short-subunit alcohol dehydrogenase family)